MAIDFAGFESHRILITSSLFHSRKLMCGLAPHFRQRTSRGTALADLLGAFCDLGEDPSRRAREVRADNWVRSPSRMKAGFPLMSAASLKIMIVDDEPSMRNLLRMGLGTQGYHVLEAPNGEIAL